MEEAGDGAGESAASDMGFPLLLCYAVPALVLSVDRLFNYIL